MAHADFSLRLRSKGKEVTTSLVVGRSYEFGVETSTSASHDDVTLRWRLEWIAEGRSTDRVVVAGASHHLGPMTPADVFTVEDAFRVPQEGPVSYAGMIVNVRWQLHVTLDIPWAFDPEQAFALRVGARKVRR